MFEKGYNLIVQCFIEFRDCLYVLVIYERVFDGECVVEFDFKLDYYLFEFNK